jgi:flavin-dependent dehydrogenase
MKILIVGGGVSGLRLRAPPRQRGFDPVVAERERVSGHARHVIRVWPLRLRRYSRCCLIEWRTQFEPFLI